MTDYYVFGSPMPGRQYTNGNKYRYTFNGKESDPETVGTAGGTQDYGMRIYNPSLGKFLSVDPIAKNFPWNSPYAFAENGPIDAIDLDGLERFRIKDGTVSIYDPKTNSRTEYKVKQLFLEKTDAKFEVIDEDGVSKETFKYQEFACQMKGFKIERQISGGDGSHRLYTPNKPGKKINTEGNTAIASTDNFALENDFEAKASITIHDKTTAENRDWTEMLQEEPAEDNKKYNAVKIVNGIPGLDTAPIIDNLRQSGTIENSSSIRIENSDSGSIQIDLGNIDCE